MPSDTDSSLLSALDELKRSLQAAHFAAREVDLLLGTTCDARRADPIHELRITAGSLQTAIHREISRLAASL